MTSNNPKVIYDNGKAFVVTTEVENAKKQRNNEIMERFKKIKEENPNTAPFTICRYLSCTYDIQAKSINATFCHSS